MVFKAFIFWKALSPIDEGLPEMIIASIFAQPYRALLSIAVSPVIITVFKEAGT